MFLIIVALRLQCKPPLSDKRIFHGHHVFLVVKPQSIILHNRKELIWYTTTRPYVTSEFQNVSTSTNSLPPRRSNFRSIQPCSIIFQCEGAPRILNMPALSFRRFRNASFGNNVSPAYFRSGNFLSEQIPVPLFSHEHRVTFIISSFTELRSCK